MGYQTNYKLKIKNQEGEDVTKATLASLVEKYAEDQDINFVLTIGLSEDGDTEEPLKGYEHEVNLHSFSKEHPDLLFKLSGEGEESSDIWDKYFKNGKMQKCYAVVVIPEFDESKMK